LETNIESRRFSADHKKQSPIKEHSVSYLLTIVAGFFIGSFCARSRIFARVPRVILMALMVIALIIALIITISAGLIVSALPENLAWIPEFLALFSVVFSLTYLVTEDMMVGL
jgi:CHASE2 domain-containing sensor protein